MKSSCFALTALLLAFLLLPLPAHPALADGAASALPEGGAYRNRVFYEIFPGTFSDSDGDGTGDLRGILNRLDYLNDGDPDSAASLGVEGLWLTPIFSSPSYHKYDVTDYYTIDPAFGTMEDLKALIDACHERNMLLILDLPINHTSTQCRWFKQFQFTRQVNDAISPWYDYYVCVAPEDRTPGHTWYQVSGKNLYYEGNFSDQMPELNFDHEEVRQAVLDVALYWLGQGADGFRFDAAKYIYLGDHEKSAAFWQWYTDAIRAEYPDAWMVAEVWDSDSVTRKYSGAMSCFDFTVSGSGGLLAETAQAGNVNRYTAYVENYLADMASLGDVGLYVPFLANHDMDRSAGYLPATNFRAQAAANLYLLGPGAPFIYYGEEIGLRGSRGGASSDANRRLAMRWGDGDPVSDPVGATYEDALQTTATVESMDGESWSLLNYYRRLLMIRRNHPEIAMGSYRALSFSDIKAGGFVSTWNGSSVMVVHNTTGRPMKIDLIAAGEGAFTVLSDFIGYGEAALADGVLSLDGQTTAVLVP